MRPRIYYSIRVRGYQGRSLAFQIHRDEVYVSVTGRFSGPARQIQFKSEEEAKRFLEQRKDKDSYDFEVVKISSWEK